MKTIIDEKPPITLTQFCGQDKDSFRRYMVAKEAMLKLYSEREHSIGGGFGSSIVFTHEEISCLFENIPEFFEFYKRSVI